jgi:hypothetical protein
MADTATVVGLISSSAIGFALGSFSVRRQLVFPVSDNHNSR